MAELKYVTVRLEIDADLSNRDYAALRAMGEVRS